MSSIKVLVCLLFIISFDACVCQKPVYPSKTEISLKDRMKYNIWQHLAEVANVTEFCLSQSLSATEALSSCLHPVCHAPSELLSITTHAQNYAKHPKTWYLTYSSWGNFSTFKPAGALSLKTPRVATFNTTCARMTKCLSSDCLVPQGEALKCTHTQDIVALNKYMSLPSGWFISCNEETFNYLPANLAEGTTCCVSRLTLILPEKHQMTPTALHTPKHARAIHKRATKLSTLTEDCDSDIHLLSNPEILGLAFSLFGVPGLTAGTAKTLGKLACLTVKNMNYTSRALSLLVQEQSILRDSLLENRAAIDYLLLRTHIGCESFGNLCCFNISDNSLAVHTQIKNLHNLVNQVKQRSGSILDLTWDALTGWLPTADWLKHIFLWSVVLGAIIIFTCCVIQCMPCCCNAFKSLRNNQQIPILPVVEPAPVQLPLLTTEERIWGRVPN